MPCLKVIMFIFFQVKKMYRSGSARVNKTLTSLKSWPKMHVILRDWLKNSSDDPIDEESRQNRVETLHLSIDCLYPEILTGDVCDDIYKLARATPFSGMFGVETETPIEFYDSPLNDFYAWMRVRVDIFGNAPLYASEEIFENQKYEDENHVDIEDVVKYLTKLQ